LSLQKNKLIEISGKIYAYDLNTKLINVYKTIQSNKNKLYKLLKKYETEYNEIETQEKYYYDKREEFNNCEDIVKNSALFIFLNKTCFRGVYRENKNKKFNVPFGNYKKINLIDKDNLNDINKLIKNVEFINLNFIDSIKNINIGDFVYLDPPYLSTNNKGFINYTNDGFDMDTHNILFDNILELHKKNINFCLSNSYTEYIVNKFNVDGIKINYILAKRCINSKNPESKAKEVLIYNKND
jgi:DNA adenine methylase